MGTNNVDHRFLRDLQDIFKSVDTDGNGRIEARELQRALDNGANLPFNINTVHMLIKMFDSDGNGTIEFGEFLQLHKQLMQWRECFCQFDVDKSGFIDARELHASLRFFGYNLSAMFVQQLMRRFDRSRRNQMAFDDFIYAFVCLDRLSNAFQRFDRQRTGRAQFSFEQFLLASLSIV